MSGRTCSRRLVLIIVLATLASALTGTAALGVTKTEVDRACASSRAALDDYRTAQNQFAQAATAYEIATVEVDRVLYRQQRAASTIEIRQTAMIGAEQRFEEQAIEAYMNAGAAASALFLGAGSLDQVLTTSEFLTATAADSRDAAGELAALQGELVTLQGQLVDLEGELRIVSEARLDAKDQQEVAMLADQTAWEKLSGRCRQLQKQFEIQVARAAAARGGGAGGVPAAATPGFICPFPGSSFIDTWGAPRSGGRGHRGTDMMGPLGAPLVAVASGTVSLANSGLGGKTLWLVSSYAVAYYYAHLSSFNVVSGQTVGKGDIVGYNGSSGNASGGAPHLHFEIHPNGRGAAAVNPYPTLVAACR
jgi:murein DD-endopeptidase MepM/ murein hydrolase activator NlpD